MGTLAIAPWKDGDMQPVMDLWQRVFADRKYDFRMDEAGFRQRVLAHPDFDPEGALIARVEGKVVGFVLAVAPGRGETGYLSVLMVDTDFRQKGLGVCSWMPRRDFWQVAEIRRFGSVTKVIRSHLQLVSM